MEVAVEMEAGEAETAVEEAEMVAEAAVEGRQAGPSQSFSQRCRVHRWWQARRWTSRPKLKEATERV